MANSDKCLEHTGVIARIDTLEGNVKQLWEKWDGVQKLLIGSLVAAILNLMAIIILLVKTYAG